MIPSNRPVIGKDLDEVRQSFGLLVSDACWLFGMSITKWMQIVRARADEPLKDPTLALLVRFLDQHPELEPIPKFPPAKVMFAEVNEVLPLDQKRFSVLFGSEASATYRWLKPGSRLNPTVGRLMYYIRHVLEDSSKTKRAQLLAAWTQTVEEEGRARGVEDIFKTGAWTPKAPRVRRTRGGSEAGASEAPAADTPAAEAPAPAVKRVVRRVKKAEVA